MFLRKSLIYEKLHFLLSLHVKQCTAFEAHSSEFSSQCWIDRALLVSKECDDWVRRVLCISVY